MNLAQNIRFLRLFKRYTQKEFGKILNKKSSVVGSYERGISLPPLDVLIEICKMYSITLNDLVFADINEAFLRKYNFKTLKNLSESSDTINVESSHTQEPSLNYDYLANFQSQDIASFNDNILKLENTHLKAENEAFKANLADLRELVKALRK